MKKTITAILAVLMIVSLLAVNLSAAQGDYKAASGTPIVDGVKDDLYIAADPVPMKVDNDGNPSKGATGTAYFLWDAKYLYAYVDVVDPVLTTKKADAIYQTDSVEVYVDFDGNVAAGKTAKVTDAGVNAGQWTAGLLYEGEWGGYGNHHTENKDKGTFKVKTTDKGYAVEYQIPFVKYTPAAAAKIGFTIAINDDANNDSTRDYQIFPAKGQGSAWSTVDGNWCLMTLSADKYTPPTTAAAAPAAAGAAAKPAAAAQTADITVITAIVSMAIASGAVLSLKKRK
ncbi:MAG: hypothetical protein GX628_04265 [Clostridiales bacterium]|nr:hypothetical protein [Clostridiales bacterium]